MTSARFRLGTAATNSAGTSWSWRSYDTYADVSADSYVKVELESKTGVSSIDVTIDSADEATLSAGTPTVTINQSTKTATFQVASTANHTYIVRTVVNSGVDQNGDSVDDYDKRLAVHIPTASGYRLFAVGEKDEYSRSYGHTGKLNDVIRNASTGAATTLAGDVTGAASANTVVALQGSDVQTSVAAAVTGAALVYGTSGWTPSTKLTKLTKYAGKHYEVYSTCSHATAAATIITIPISTNAYCMVEGHLVGADSAGSGQLNSYVIYTAARNSSGTAIVEATATTLLNAGDGGITIESTVDSANLIITLADASAVSTWNWRGRFSVEEVDIS